MNIWNSKLKDKSKIVLAVNLGLSAVKKDKFWLRFRKKMKWNELH